jgi:hypothetical protein
VAESRPHRDRSGIVRFYCWICLLEHEREGHFVAKDTFRLHGVNNDLCDNCGTQMVPISESVEPLAPVFDEEGAPS